MFKATFLARAKKGSFIISNERCQPQKVYVNMVLFSHPFLVRLSCASSAPAKAGRSSRVLRRAGGRERAGEGISGQAVGKPAGMSAGRGGWARDLAVLKSS